MKKLKNKYILLTALLVLFIPSWLSAQDYTIDWSDTATYSTSCGKITSSQWSVRDDSCVMTTPNLQVINPAGCTVSFSFRINQSGNGQPTDKCYVFHQVDGGLWILDTLFIAGATPQVYPYSDHVWLGYNHIIKFKVCMETKAHTEFWAIKEGDVIVTDGDNTETDIIIYHGMPLPVEIVSFSGYSGKGIVTLCWSTASESNNDYYSIERSVDGISFEGIGIVQGAGNSNSLLEYKYTDYAPVEVAYYRLKQTDFDGKFSYSQIINVDEKAEGADIISVNSTGSILNLIATIETSGKIQINLYSIGGSLVYSKVIHVIEGINSIIIDPEITTSSVYIVKVSVNNGIPLTTKVYLN